MTTSVLQLSKETGEMVRSHVLEYVDGFTRLFQGLVGLTEALVNGFVNNVKAMLSGEEGDDEESMGLVEQMINTVFGPPGWTGSSWIGTMLQHR